MRNYRPAFLYVWHTTAVNRTVFRYSKRNIQTKFLWPNIISVEAILSLIKQLCHMCMCNYFINVIRILPFKHHHITSCFYWLRVLDFQPIDIASYIFRTSNVEWGGNINLPCNFTNFVLLIIFQDHDDEFVIHDINFTKTLI